MVRLPLPYSKLLGFSHRTLLAEWEKPPSFKPVAGTTKIHRACERRTGHDRRNAPKGRCHGRRDSRRGALLGLDSQQGRRRSPCYLSACEKWMLVLSYFDEPLFQT